MVEPDDPRVNLFGPEKVVTEVTHPETPYTTVAGGSQSDPCCDGLSALIEKLSPWHQSRSHLVDKAVGNRLPVGRPDSSDDVRNLFRGIQLRVGVALLLKPRPGFRCERSPELPFDLPTKGQLSHRLTVPRLRAKGESPYHQG